MLQQGTMALTQKRSPLAATLLALLASGLGQIYNGQPYKGIIFFLSGYFLIIASALAGLHRYFYGLVGVFALRIAWQAYIIADALVVSIKRKEIVLNFYNKAYIFVIFVLISFLSILTINPLINNRLVGIKSYSIPGGAMQPTLLVGDNIIADQNYYHNTRPQRGEVLIFIYPKDPSIDYLKRVIGLPGDKVEIKDKKVYINGQEYRTAEAVFNDPKIYRGPGDPRRDNFGPVTLPPDNYFVMGDNRDLSFDSRFWGFVPLDRIKGKVLYIYFSRDKEKSQIRWSRFGQAIR
jgi:signal peptidase I